MLEKRQNILLLFIFIIALGVRLYPVWTPNVITNDGVRYIDTAKMILAGDFKKIKDVSFFNLYPFMILIFQKMFGNWELSGRMVSVIFGSISIIPLFFMVKSLVDIKIAFAVSLFYSINPHIVEYSSDVLRDPLFWSLFLFALWTGVEGLNDNKWFLLFLSALFSGLSMFTRIEGVMIIFIIILWGVWLYFKGNLMGKAFLSRILMFLAFIPIIFSPSLFFIREKLGWWELGLLWDKISYMLTNNQSLEGIIKIDAPTIDKTSVLFKGFLDISLRHRYVLYLFEIVYKFIKSINIVFMALFLFGIIKRKKYRLMKGEVFFIIWFLVAFVVSYLYVAKIQYISTRHGLLMGIPALLWIGIGYFEIADRVKRFFEKKRLSEPFLFFMPYFIIFIILAVNIPVIVASSVRDDKIELKKAGIYLKDMGYGEKRIAMTPSLLRVAFYAEAVPVTISEWLTDEEFKKIMIEKKAEYLLIDENKSPRFLKENDLCKYLTKLDIPNFKGFKKYSMALFKIESERGY